MSFSQTLCVSAQSPFGSIGHEALYSPLKAKLLRGRGRIHHCTIGRLGMQFMGLEVFINKAIGNAGKGGTGDN